MKISNLFLFIILITVQPMKGNCDEYKGGLTIEGGEYSLGQSQWKYKNGNFIVYGGEAGTIFYMLFSNLKFGSFDAFDYAPNPGNETGSLEIILKNRTTSYNFHENKILLVFISEEEMLCHDYVAVPLKEWKEFMQQYANTLQNEEFLVISEHFKTKTINCR